MKPKRLLTVILLAFVAVSVGVLIAKEIGDRRTSSQATVTSAAPARDRDRLVVYYFHGEARCATCRTIEAYTKEAIDTGFAQHLKDGSMEFHVINVETASTVHFIDDYQLVSPSVVVVRYEENAQVAWKYLDKVWRLAGNKSAFLGYIRDETAAVMQGRS